MKQEVGAEAFSIQTKILKNSHFVQRQPKHQLTSAPPRFVLEAISLGTLLFKQTLTLASPSSSAVSSPHVKGKWLSARGELTIVSALGRDICNVFHPSFFPKCGNLCRYKESGSMAPLYAGYRRAHSLACCPPSVQ